MVPSLALRKKATIFRSILLCAVGRYPAPCCRTTLPAVFIAGSELSYTGAFVGAPRVRLMLRWTGRGSLSPSRKQLFAGQGKKLGEHQDGAGADGCWGDATVLLAQHPVRHSASWHGSCPRASHRSRNPGM